MYLCVLWGKASSVPHYSVLESISSLLIVLDLIDIGEHNFKFLSAHAI
jgi:hypothetical protein